MAFRSQAALSLILAASVAAAQEYSVRHRHLRNGAEGILRFTPAGVAFEEPGKHAAHSREWRFEEIQRFDLSPSELRILTYEDDRKRLNADREFVFDKLPPKMPEELYASLSARLDQRFIARVPDNGFTPLWSMPAKMLTRRGAGANGTLHAGAERISFDSPAGSRTWRYHDIQSIATENPYELTIHSLDRETRIQLKQELREDVYNDLWRRIEEANGLRAYHSTLESHHD